MEGTVPKPRVLPGGTHPGRGRSEQAAERLPQGLRRLCDRKKILLIYDEVQVGMGNRQALCPRTLRGCPGYHDHGQRAGGRRADRACLATEELRKASPPERMRHGGIPGSAAGVAHYEYLEDGILVNCQRASAISWDDWEN